MSRHVPVCVTGVFCGFILYTGLYKNRIPSSQQYLVHANALQQRGGSTGEAICGFTGNSDIYGLGIRLGTYLQWVAALVSKELLSDGRSEVIRELVDVNIIFSLAIFIATTLLPFQPNSSYYGVETLIMLHIYFGNTYLILYDRLLKGAPKQSATFYGILMSVWVTTGMSMYAIYFWFYGLKFLPETPCGSYAFLFAKVDLTGNALTFFKIAATFNAILWGSGFAGITFYAIPWLFYSFLRVLSQNVAYFIRKGAAKAMSNKDMPDGSWRGINTVHTRYVFGSYLGLLGLPKGVREQQAGWPSDEKQSPPKFTITGIWKYASILILVYSILAIELIIRWNSIKGIYTIRVTGQIIPFIIGGGSLVKVLFAVLVLQFGDSSVWSTNNRCYRMKDGRWAKFPLNTVVRRHSWSAEGIVTDIEHA